MAGKQLLGRLVRSPSPCVLIHDWNSSMKTYVLAVVILGIFSSVAFSQSPAEKELVENLLKRRGSVKALETVLKKPDEYSALVLYLGANVAYRKKRLEDSAFLYFTAQLRTHFDRECFPPKDEGGNDPFLVHMVFSLQFGEVLNPAVTAEPRVYERVLARVKKWTPKASPEFEPGYEYTERRSEKDAHAAVHAHRTKFIEAMSGTSTFLNDAEYFAAFRVIQTYNSSSDDKQPTKEAYDNAVETVKRIEKDKGIELHSKSLDEAHKTVTEE